MLTILLIIPECQGTKMPRDLGGCDEAFPGDESKVGGPIPNSTEFGYVTSRKATFCRGKNSSQSLT